MPGLSWFLAQGKTQYDAVMRDIPYPRMELAVHYANRLAQIGASGLVAAAFGLAYRELGCGPNIFMQSAVFKYPNKERFLYTWFKYTYKYGRYVMMASIALAPVCAYAEMAQKGKANDIEAYKERCFDLRHDRHQVRIDTSGYLGIFSCICYCVMRGNPWMVGVCFGLPIGVIHGATINHYFQYRYY